MHLPLLLFLLYSAVNCQTVEENLLINYNEVNPSYNTIITDEQVNRKLPRYVIMAPRVVRPNSVYRITATILESDEIHALDIRASILNDGTELSSATEPVHSNQQSLLLLRIPGQAMAGHYKLRIEGNLLGTAGGTVFSNETMLEFSSKFLTVLVQTSRPVYTGGQTVYFRAVLLTTELKPFDDTVDVFLVDPSGIINKRWPTRQTSNGVVSLSFKLPEFAALGDWMIRIVAQGQIEHKNFTVEKYFEPRFEVVVNMKPFFLVSDRYVEGVVMANYTNFKAATGNCSINISARHLTEHLSQFQTVHHYFLQNFDGAYKFRFPMVDLASKVPYLDGSEIRVEARVGEHFLLMYQSGFTLARVINSSVSVRFLSSSPQVFKPGMPFTTHIAVSYHDYQQLPSRKLGSGRIYVKSQMSGSSAAMNEVFDIPPEGVIRVKLDVPQQATRIKLTATYEDEEGDVSESDLLLVPYFSSSEENVQLTTSTYMANQGEFAIVHLRADFYIQTFHYMVIAKGMILYAGSEELQDISIPSITTFSLPVSSEMAPVFSVLAYHITRRGKVLMDLITIPVNAIGKHKVDLILNPQKDHSANRVEFIVKGEIGSTFGISVLRRDTFNLQTGHELSTASIMEQLYDFQEEGTPINKMTFRSRYGEPDRSFYFPTLNYGVDANRTVGLSGLVVMTESEIGTYPRPVECDESKEMKACSTTGCYHYSKECDGYYDCDDRSDESKCTDLTIEDVKHFKLNRQNRIWRFYDPVEGDWAWKEVRRIGKDIFFKQVPKRPEHWVLNMFAVGKEQGLGIISQPIQFDSTRSFMMIVECADTIRQWEQMSLRAAIFNFMDAEIEAMIILPNSPDYKFVHVEHHGWVDSYKPRSTFGEHQHLVFIPPHESLEVYIPIVPQRKGDMNITLKAVTQVGEDEVTKTVKILPEGVLVRRHTSTLLDLKNRANVFMFVDVFVEETPIITHVGTYRRYVYGTPQASISVYGDVVGPAFPTVPVTTEVLLDNPAIGGDAAAFDFGMNLWTLHYQRLTNQLNLMRAKDVFRAMTEQYSALLNYRNSDGSFSMWMNSGPSVWITSQILQLLEVAQFPDWENLLYIDPYIVSSGVAWMLRYQEPWGAFREIDNMSHPINREMMWEKGARFHNLVGNISLTAHIVVTLDKAMQSLQGEIRGLAVEGRHNAIRYLESMLPNMEDPYELAITSYALTITKSREAQRAYSQLDLQKREQENRIYWSREKLDFNEFRWESGRPFLMFKDHTKWDAHAVGASAYALLVYLHREGITLVQERIIEWFCYMRKHVGGFDATQDTLIAMQALVEYSYRARLRDVTDMTILLEPSSDLNKSKTFSLDEENLAKLQSIEISRVFGFINVAARGSGQGVFQLDVTYGVDHEPLMDQPPVRAFDLFTQLKFVGRNNSLGHYRACQRWVLDDESETSGAAVLEIALPSGYRILQPDLDYYVAHSNVPQLQYAYAMPTKTAFYFNYLDRYLTCVNLTIMRWHPVSNMTRYMSAKVYEMYSPERFNESMVETLDLYVLNVCDVCGSYQCPYCPIFSVASLPVASVFVLLLLPLLLPSLTSLR